MHGDLTVALMGLAGKLVGLELVGDAAKRERPEKRGLERAPHCGRLLGGGVHLHPAVTSDTAS